MATQQKETPGQTSQGSSPNSETPPQEGDQSQASQGQQGGQASGGDPQVYEAGGRKFNSPQEMAQYIGSLTTTVREQGRALNDLASRQQGSSEGVTPVGRPGVAQGGQPQESDADLNKRYWDDPVGVLRQEMSRMIAPFQQDLAQSRQHDAVSRLRQEYSQYVDLEHMVDATMAQSGQPRTYENLRAAYFMVKGYMAETGQSLGQAQNQPATTQNAPQNGPPQHRPSNAPIPQQQPGGTRKRELTEDERRIARLGGYTDEQYLSLLELNEDEIVTSTIGVPQS